MLLVLVVGAGIYAYVHRRAGDVVHPHARFVPEATPRPGGPDRFTWPLFGYVKDHTRYFPADSRLHPPFVSRWLYNGHSLLEFPPVISGATIYQLNDSGVLLAIAKSTGRIRWTAHLGVLAASTPAASGDTVYVTILDRAAGSTPGEWSPCANATEPSAGHETSPAAASPPPCLTAAACTSALRAAPFMPCGPPTGGCSGPTMPTER